MGDISDISRSAKECDIRLLDKTLENGTDINEEGSYLLLNAVIFGTYKNKEYIDFLIKNGIDINQKSRTGRTALHFASMLSNYDVVKQLVENKIDVNAITTKKYNALMEACENQFLCAPSQIWKDMMPYYTYDEYLNLQLFYNKLNFVRSSRKELLENQLKIIKYLLENGINKEQVSIDNNSALDLAIENQYINNTKMVEILSEYDVPMVGIHNTNINYFDALFYGGPLAFINDSIDCHSKVRKLKAVNKQK